MKLFKKNVDENSFDKTRNMFLLSNNHSFVVQEAYKSTRMNILFSLADKMESCKTILITSSIPAEGKTTTCLNLGISFAQTDAKVLVIDADLRRPRIHTTLEADNTIGLTNVLAGFAKIEDAIKSHETGIDFITSGHEVPNPAELLSSKKMEEMLDFLSEKYDYIFIDTPPLAAVSDATALIKKSDGVILVAKYKFSKKEDIKNSLSNLEFANAKILGIVLNGTERYMKSSAYSYRERSRISAGYGRYGRFYGYGHGYGHGDGNGDNEKNPNQN